MLVFCSGKKLHFLSYSLQPILWALKSAIKSNLQLKQQYITLQNIHYLPASTLQRLYKNRQQVFRVSVDATKRRKAVQQTPPRWRKSFFLFFIFKYTYRRLKAPVCSTVFHFVSRKLVGGSKCAKNFSFFKINNMPVVTNVATLAINFF